MNLSTTIRKIQNTLSYSKSGYLLTYTLLFVFVSVLSFLPFFQDGVGFVWTGTSQDGYTQHCTALMYFGQWGREIIRTLMNEHQLVIPMWDFSIGYGSDIMTTMHYYAFGDPLNLLSIIVPSRYTEFLYDFLVILRLYLAGCGFSLFCFKMGRKKVATVAGSIAYVFCGYALFSAVRHPFFINPMIYLPLILLGAEKVLRKESVLLFVFMVCISTISNFYFLYMIVFAVILYVIIRYFTMERNKGAKDFSLLMGKFLLTGITGIGMGAIVFLPVVNVFLSSTRLKETGGGLAFLYSPAYYERLLAGAFSAVDTPSWTCLGYTAPIFVAVITMFMCRKKYLGLKIGFCILSVMAMLPIFGKVLNGFSYVSNRWTFILAGLVAYILASVWDDMLAISKKKLAVATACCVIYFILLIILSREGEESTYTSVCIIFITIALLFLNQNDIFRNLPKIVLSTALAALVVLSSCVNAYYKYSPQEMDYVSEFLWINGGLKGIEKSSDKAAALVSKKDKFARNEQSSTSNLNASAITKSKGVQYYWSLENGYIAQFLKENCHYGFMAQKYDGLNSRAYLDALASIKYYIKTNRSTAPYGFKPFKEIKFDGEKYKTLKNKFALPIGYTYSSYIDRKDYLKLTPSEKQQAMLQGVVLENKKEDKELDNYRKTQLSFFHKVMDYNIKTGKKVILQEDGSFLVNKKNGKITLTFDGLPESETYIHIGKLQVEPKTKYELYMDDCQQYFTKDEFEALSRRKERKFEREYKHKRDSSDGQKVRIAMKSNKSKVTMTHYGPDYKYTTGQTEYLVNMGYCKTQQNKITIKFPITGVYKLDGLEVICQPMEDYKLRIKERKEEILKNIKIDTNKIEGKISLKKDKILCLSIPYNTGWSATVDGKKTKLFQANTMYMALPLEKGEHKIVLTYNTPMIREGAYITLVSTALFMGMLTFYVIRLFRIYIRQRRRTFSVKRNN